MKIKRKHLSRSLAAWIEREVGLGPMVGEVHYLVTSGSLYEDRLQEAGISADNIHTTYALAYAALTADQNDVLVVSPEAHNLSGTASTWAKSNTHILGAGSPIHINQRARIYNSGAACTPMMTWSGNGCIVKNVMFDQQGSHATTAAVCFKMTGARNYMENVTYRHIGALAAVDNSWRPFVMNSSNGENLFRQCTFGNDTVDGVTAANYTFEFNGAVETARNKFDDCIFWGNGSANSCFILATTVSSLSSFQFFKECKFINNDHGDMDAMTQGFNLNADAGGHFIFEDCLVYGATTLETANSGVIQVRNAYAAATSDTCVAATF